MSFFSVLFRYQSHSSSQILKMYHMYHFVYQHVSLSNEDSTFCIILLCMYHVKVCIKEGPYVSLKVSKCIKNVSKCINVSTTVTFRIKPRITNITDQHVSTFCIIIMYHITISLQSGKEEYHKYHMAKINTYNPCIDRYTNYTYIYFICISTYNQCIMIHQLDVHIYIRGDCH